VISDIQTTKRKKEAKKEKPSTLFVLHPKTKVPWKSSVYKI